MMDIESYKKFTAAGGYLAEGSEAQAMMRPAAVEAQRITAQINGSFHSPEELRALFSELIGKPVDDTFALFPPVYTDFGKNITIGKNVFINSGCCFQDQGGVEIGDGCLIGHQVVFATLNHDLAPEKRANMIPGTIRLGRNVWVGSHATLLAGVSVGDNAVIAAGAVVTKDVPPDTLVGGVPARVIRSGL